MKTIAFGPERDVPSWNWVGFDTSRELSKYYNIITYSNLETPPKADVVFIIKQRPPEQFVANVKKQRSKTIYVPIDYYADAYMMKSDNKLLEMFDMILLHCERTIPYMERYNQQVFFVEHNNKYALPEMASYKEDGYILWVGGCQYVAYLVHWLQENPIKYPIKILCDIDNDRARNAASIYASDIGMNFSIPKGAKQIAGMDVFTWSERLQYEMMTECKAALDIKLTQKWNQHHKPPTKAQKYIASGIPFAINGDSYSAEYFNTKGFEVASPKTTTRWFSMDYWQQTKNFGEKLREYTSIESVGLRYKKLIEKL